MARLSLALLTCGGGAEAQQALEWQVHGIGTFVVEAESEQGEAGRFLGGGAALGFRTSGRLRAAVWASLGDRSGTVAFRPEGQVTFLLNPYKRRGLTPYGGGGVAAVLTRGADAQYLLVVLGVEASPGGPSGWFVEGGLGGGVRVAVGFRRRWRRGA